MAFVYELNPPRSTTPINTDRMDPNAAYLRHYDNLLFLDFMAENGSREERWQAEREMEICRRKMNFWKHHRNFDAQMVLKEREKRNQQWKREKRQAKHIPGIKEFVTPASKME